MAVNQPLEQELPVDISFDAKKKRLRRLAWFLDSSVPLPFLGYRIGADGIIGLIPGLGDAVGTLLSSYIVLEASRLGASKSVLLRMVFNIAVESVIGLIPFFGDLFDMGWKSNQRNIRLLDTYLQYPVQTRKQSRVIAASIILGFIVLTLLFLILSVMILRWLWSAVTAV